MRKDKNLQVDRAVIWDVKMLKVFKANMGIYTEKPVKNFDLIMISAYMALQVMNVVPFLLQSRIDPRKENREEIVILGGNVSLFYKMIERYVDVFYFGDGEKYVHKLLEAKRKAKDKKEFLDIIRNTQGLKGVIYTGVEKEISLAVNEDISTAILDKNSFISKPVNKVVEIARGCKYSCNFCLLAHTKHPYRYNSVEKLKPAIHSFNKDTSIYPFAPDEASYPEKQNLIKEIENAGCKPYSYNKRFDSFEPEVDLGYLKTTTRVVFGLDGVSQKFRDFAKKGITPEQIWRGLKASIEDKDITLIKLNVVLGYPDETWDDWKELRDLFIEACKYRAKVRKAFSAGGEEVFKRIRKGKKIEEPLFFQLAPTPFVPEPGTPFEFMATDYKESDKEHLEKMMGKITDEYSFVKMEGLNGVAAHQVETFINRAGRETQAALHKWFQFNGYKIFGNSMAPKFLSFLRTEGIRIEEYLKEIDRSVFSEINFRYPEEKRKRIFERFKNKLNGTFTRVTWRNFSE
jgi:radical SAM superfamily enzyme YgiQ (UPF0313 family)